MNPSRNPKTRTISTTTILKRKVEKTVAKE